MTRAAPAVLALTVVLAHLAYLPATLEDIDSVNFALGIRDFDVAKHRPHPPGYPVYIALGKTAVAAARPFSGRAPESSIEARTLAVLSLIGTVLAIPLLYRTLTCWSSARTAGESDPPASTSTPWQRLDAGAIAATALATACPLSWYLAVRPMSDVPGLAAAFAAQAALSLAWWRQRPGLGGDRRMLPDMATASGLMILLGALLTALAIGFRTQNALLTLPLLAGLLLDRIGRGFAPAVFGSVVALTVGCLLWAVPLVVASGGIDAYLAALGVQAGEDFAGGEMLYLNPAPRLIAIALLRTFIYPWDSVVLGGVICGLAALGAVMLLVRDRRTFAAVFLVAVPYLAFHLLFQDTSYVRYALPLVAPVAFLVIRGVENVAPRVVVPAAALLTIWSVVIASPVVAAYGSEPSPTAQAVAAMEQRRASGPPGVLGMHQTYRRPLEAETLDLETLPSPPRREWLELARYWREGGTAPLWFLADPRRSDLALIDPRSRRDHSDFTWTFTSLSQIGGMRPAAVTWIRMPPPGWFAEEGWSLTPETAGMARLAGRGPSIAPITAWVRRRPDPVHVLVGGRHLGSPGDPAVQFTVAIDEVEVARWDAKPGFFVQEFDLPANALAGSGPLARLTVASRAPEGRAIATAIEQFDLQTRGTLMWAFDEGWHEAEYDPALGLWRWTSEAATLRVIDAHAPVAVTLRVEPPRHYFDADPAVQVTAGGQTIGATDFRSTPLWSVIVPLDALQAANGRVTIRTNRTFIPRDRAGNSDQRHLGLRVLSVNIASQP